MESFLAGRATVAKMPSTGDRTVPSGDGFSPMFEKRQEPVAVAPAAVPAASAIPAKTISPAPEPTAHAHNVSVEVVRVDGAVQGIVVTCKCGERIELDCIY